MPHLVGERKNRWCSVTSSQRSQSKQTFLAARGSMFSFSRFKSRFWQTHRLCGEHKPQTGLGKSRCAECVCSAPPAVSYDTRFELVPYIQKGLDAMQQLEQGDSVFQIHGARPHARHACFASHKTAPPSSIGQSQRFLRTWGHPPRPIQVHPCHRYTPREVFGPDEIPATTICVHHWGCPSPDT